MAMFYLLLLLFFVLGVQIVDPKLASYGVENPIYAVIQLAQTTMRSELGKITLDKTFEERDTLNEKIVVSLAISSLNLFVLVICSSFPYLRKHLRYFNFKSHLKSCWWEVLYKAECKLVLKNNKTCLFGWSYANCRNDDLFNYNFIVLHQWGLDLIEGASLSQRDKLRFEYPLGEESYPHLVFGYALNTVALEGVYL